jgi:alpha-L-fucosidase 2
MVTGLFQHNMLPNLWTTHPPFQMDGNFGITAGISEMLLQSHAGEIVPLPALPTAWKDGHFKGLRARGGFTLDAAWKNGRPTELVILSTAGEPMALRLPAGWKPGDGRGPAAAANEDGVVKMKTERGQRYSFRW